jgi:sulfatase maturation enzyme AslB (radical SAM superfamily)
MLDFLYKSKNPISVSRDVSPTICPLPFMSFYGTASGAVVACCESQETKMGAADSPLLSTWNNNAYKQLRKDLLKGKKPELCKKCWRNEASGLKSNRQQALEDYEAKLLNEESVLASLDGTCSSFPSFIELKCSNVCNLKCRMCHPESSHRILEDREIIDLYRKGLPWSPTPLRPTFLFEQIKNLKQHQLKKIRVLQYSGGEPLISREQFELTAFLAEKYGENIQLRYSTNLNTLTFEKFNAIELWKKFRHVHVKISADGIDDVYNYIRAGGSFEILKKNLDSLLSADLKHLDIAIGFTTQIYNIFQLPEFLDFFSNYVSADRITTHLLYTPTLFCIDNMPHELTNKIMLKLRSSRWNFSDKINFLEKNKKNSENTKNWQDFLSYTEAFEKKYNQVGSGYSYLLNKYLSEY